MKRRCWRGGVLDRGWSTVGRRRGRQGSARAAGFSFGSRIALQLAAQESGIGRVIAAGFPTRVAEREYAYRVRVPKYFVQSTRDEFGPREELAAFFESLAEPKQLEWVEAEDHFFAGALDAFEGVVERIGRRGLTRDAHSAGHVFALNVFSGKHRGDRSHGEW